jgi:hypothetical protein
VGEGESGVVLTSSKQELAFRRLIMRPHYLPAVPSVAKYKDAFLQIKANLTSGHVSMLKAQYDTPGHVLTARELAGAAGYKNFNAANLQYGKIGNMLRDVLNYWDDSGQASYVLSWFLRPNDVGKEWSIVMHKEVAQALRELNWFGVQQIGDYVQYHNSEAMGVSCLELVDSDENGFDIATSRPISKLTGSRIWLIGGIGKPREYYLCYYFFVDEIEPSDGYSSFKYSAYGQKGKIFKPAILLNNVQWFKGFLKSQQNFSLGLRKIEKRYINKLEKLISSQGALESEVGENGDKVGGGFGYFKTNKKIEEAAISTVTNDYKKRGWKVTSVESEKCGFDLLCIKASKEEHVEVKGIQSKVLSFIITAGEVKKSQSDKKFVICVVTSASSNPKLHKFTAKDFGDQFDLEAIAYRAFKKSQ